jgi:branched-chain amino acid transport system permease protein
MNDLASVIVGSVAPASIYALISLGFVLIYRATRVFNFIHGQLVFIGALLFVTTFNRIDHSSIWLPLVVSIAVSLVIGGALYQVFMRPLTGQGVFTMIMVTLILGTTMVNGVIAMVWGTQIYPIDLKIDRTAIALPFGAFTDRKDIVTILVSAITISAIAALLKFSRFGIQMRAAAESPMLASYAGVNVSLISTVTWAIATGAAALAGIATGARAPIDFNIINLGLYAFPAIILGGLDSVIGALIGSYLLALVQTATATYVPLGGLYVDVASYVFMLVVLMVRPYGLFGTKELRRL